MILQSLAVAILFLTLSIVSAAAQDISGGLDLSSLLPEGSGSASARIVQFIALITVLSLAPGLLIMVTSFTRIIVALSFLRAGIGLQTTPANLIVISLGLFMTFYVMGPVFDDAWNNGVQPLTAGEISEEQAYREVTSPFRDFMLAHVRPRDLELFADLAGVDPNSPEALELRTLIPAFMISELRRGFEIGFLILLPFLVIDLIVATLIMSMGMMMMPPTIIALPFKVMFFVLIDGWNLLVGSLVRSFA
ncbi:MAG: flagellar type III secretion system pore protein FliP [Pseudomonadota bacterium]